VHDGPEIELRIALDPETQLGPSKAALLQATDETSSIAAAGRRMGMSYKRAWYLAQIEETSVDTCINSIAPTGGNHRRRSASRRQGSRKRSLG
jgi:molybdate transport repressor ModE-like protein